MSVITQAIVNRMLQDPVLAGTYTNGVPNGDGLLSVYQMQVYDPDLRTGVNKKFVAVFDYDDIPTGVKNQIYAYIIAAGHVSDIPSTTARSKQRRARDIQRDIVCYYKQDQNSNTNDFDFQPIERIAERVYELFDRATLTIPNPEANYTRWQAVKCTCNGPILVPKEKETFYSPQDDVMIVTVNLTIVES